jgi:hypothetical protein
VSSGARRQALTAVGEAGHQSRFDLNQSALHFHVAYCQFCWHGFVYELAWSIVIGGNIAIAGCSAVLRFPIVAICPKHSIGSEPICTYSAATCSRYDH